MVEQYLEMIQENVQRKHSMMERYRGGGDAKARLAVITDKKMTHYQNNKYVSLNIIYICKIIFFLISNKGM